MWKILGASALTFQNNERCTYDIDYGFINAGHAKYYIKERKDYFQVIIQGGSNTIVDLFFPSLYLQCAATPISAVLFIFSVRI